MLYPRGDVSLLVVDSEAPALCSIIPSPFFISYWQKSRPQGSSDITSAMGRIRPPEQRGSYARIHNRPRDPSPDPFIYRSLQDDDFHDIDEEPTQDDGKRLASIVDEREQIVGVERLNALKQRITKLDKELQLLRSTSHNVASSAKIFLSVLRFRQRLAQFKYIAQHNAKTLFPGKVRPPKYPAEIRVHALSRSPKPLQRIHLEQFPLELEEFAKEVEMFVSRLQRFREVESTSDIDVFWQKLKYSGIYLRKMSSFRSPELRLHIHNRLVDIGEHFDGITDSLKDLRNVGMPAVRSSQQHTADSLQGLATVATLFAGVAATTLQFSWEMQPQTKASIIAVNTFWFSSLVLAITAAVGSMLWRTWRLSVYRTRRRDIPWWILMWIYHSAPLVFLVLSIASFLIGLCVFAYTSNQHVITFTITTALTAMTSIGLIVISLWLAYEQLAKYGDVSYTTDPQTDLPAILNYISNQWRSRRQRIQDKDSEKGDNLDDKSMSNSDESWEMVAPKTSDQERQEQKALTHDAVVNDLQFSPNGKYLATAGWDKNVKIWKIVSSGIPELLHVLEHNDFVHEVQWAGDSNRVFTRTGAHVIAWHIQISGKHRVIKEWKVEHVKSIIWSPVNQGILAVTNTQIRILPIDSDKIGHQDFDKFDMKLRGIALTPPNDYVVGVGTRGKEGKSILAVLYSTKDKDVSLNDARVELSTDVRAIDIVKAKDSKDSSSDHWHTLVSYDNQTPPELWKINKPAPSSSEDNPQWSFKKLRTYRTWEITDASRRCCFGGTDDEFVMCAGKDGGIFRWDRDSGELLDHIASRKTFSCIQVSWNKGNENKDKNMIATGEHDGDIKIWEGEKDTLKRSYNGPLVLAPTT